MGFSSFFQPGTLMQLIAVMVFTVVYIMLVVHCKPYSDRVDDTLAIANQAMLFLTLLGALMLKFHHGFSSMGVYEEGYDPVLVTTTLIGCVIVVAIGAAVAAVVSTVDEIRQQRTGTETLGTASPQQQGGKSRNEGQPAPTTHSIDYSAGSAGHAGDAVTAATTARRLVV